MIRSFYLFLFTAVIFFANFPMANIYAMKAKQRRYYKSGVYYYDLEDCASDPGTGAINAIKSNGTIEGFIDTYGQAAFDIGKQAGIPYEAILAQSGIESGWGQSKLTTQGNNFFGIKADASWDGKVLSFPTFEANPPRTIVAQFRAYDSPAAGFEGYANFIKENERYKEALKYPGDPARYIQEVAKAGYATDPEYATKNISTQKTIINYIKSKNLFPPSSEVAKTSSPTNGTASASSSDSCTQSGGQDGGSVVSVAEREYQKNKGILEYEGDIKEYTAGRQEAWCADFVSWVYKSAGTPFTDGPPGGDLSWQHPGVTELQAWFKSKQIYFAAGGNQEPKPGDVAFYIGAQTADGGSSEHVNIVVAVNGDTITTIGGNESQQILKRSHKATPGAESLVGFGRLKQ